MNIREPHYQQAELKTAVSPNYRNNDFEIHSVPLAGRVVCGKKIVIEYVEDFDRSYCANVSINGKLVPGIAENVSWRALHNSIAKILSEKYSLRHNNGYGRKDLEWTKLGRKRYAVINLYA